jgi:peptidoglycan hydrolase-like protein with peptidoglycan-binding domain
MTARLLTIKGATTNLRGMKTFSLIAAFATVFSLTAAPLLAQNIALVFGNNNAQAHALGNNDNQAPRNAPLTGQVLDVVAPLQRAGYQVISLQNADEQALKGAVDTFVQQLESADRAVIVLAGRFATLGKNAWFLPAGVTEPGVAMVAFDGLALDTLMFLLAQKPGGAALFVAPEAGSMPLGELDIPQGVLLVRAAPGALVGGLEIFLTPGNSTAEAAAQVAQQAQISGYVSAFSSLAARGPSEPTNSLTEAFYLERAYWQLAQELATQAGYARYLRRYPAGLYAPEARAALQAIKDAKPASPTVQQIENDLALSRENRRQIQRNLALLGFDPRGIDGVFGKATRSAIAGWQTRNNRQVSGYVTAKDLVLLRRQAENRARELAAEARRKQLAAEAADAAFWQITGAKGKEAGLRAYLRKYPDGLSSDKARKALTRIENDKRRSMATVEKAFWDQARGTNTQAAYKSYLGRYPNGVFAEAAKARIAELADKKRLEEAIKAAKAQEDSMRLNSLARVLVEKRLNRLGLKAGPEDGQFDKKTRRALRRFQRARDFTVTGYLTRQTLVRLIAESGP